MLRGRSSADAATASSNRHASSERFRFAIVTSSSQHGRPVVRFWPENKPENKLEIAVR
jgi:hypothetical protein